MSDLLTPQKESSRPITKWWAFNITDTFKRLDAVENGLTLEEAQARQKKYGLNILPEKEIFGTVDILIRQIKSSLVLVLLAASLISLLLGDFIDAGVILLAVLINVLVGFWQELKSSRTLSALQKIIVNNCKILRAGDEKVILTSELVPGDMVILSAGDIVPADLRLFQIHNLKINEAALTGESLPREKENKVLDEKIVLAERINMGFMGTIVVEGNCHGVVVATGQNTEIGKIAQLVSEIKQEKTPLQKKLDKFALFLTRMILIIAGIILILGIIFGHTLKEMFAVSVAVAVSAIPEGLAVTVTVVLAIGMHRILKRNALVKKLLSAEVLGSTDVICVDKTGTLTEGKMRVAKIITDNSDFEIKSHKKELDQKAAEEQMFILRIGMLCNNAYVAQKKDELKIDHLVGNLTEKALLLAGLEIGISKQELQKQYPRLDEIPFDPRYKFMMTLHEFDKQHNIIYLKGAPEQLFLFSNYIYTYQDNKHLELNQAQREKWFKIYEEMSKQGLRVLALGYKKVPSEVKMISDKTMNEETEKPRNIETKEGLAGNKVIKQTMSDLYTNFVLVGMVGIKDPIRENVAETVQITKSAGMEIVMITGDNKFTAQVIAKEIGLDVKDGHIMEGEKLEKISETELKEKVRQIKVYSRTTPEHKLKIIKAWQDLGKVVAMTGDGINDSPALKQADIGIALGTGSDVAKETADVVLLDNDFKTIVEAVRQGRIIFVNIKKIILYFLSDSFAEVTIIITGLLLKWPLPVLASQIIWVNLIDDTLPSLALTQDVVDWNVMRDKPIKKDESMLNFEGKFLIGLISLTTALFVLFSFWFFWKGNDSNIVLARTIAFTVLGISTLFYIFSVRNLKKPFWQTKFWNNKFLIFSVIFGIFLQSLVIYNPFLQRIFNTMALNIWHWIYVISVGVFIVLIIESVKWVFNKKQ